MKKKKKKRSSLPSEDAAFKLTSKEVLTWKSLQPFQHPLQCFGVSYKIEWVHPPAPRGYSIGPMGPLQLICGSTFCAISYLNTKSLIAAQKMPALQFGWQISLIMVLLYQNSFISAVIIWRISLLINLYFCWIMKKKKISAIIYATIMNATNILLSKKCGAFDSMINHELQKKLITYFSDLEIRTQRTNAELNVLEIVQCPP